MDANVPTPHRDEMRCAGLPHPFVSVFVFYCTHEQRWGGWIDAGSSTDDMTDAVTEELIFGPFDNLETVSRMAMAMLTPDALRFVRDTAG